MSSKILLFLWAFLISISAFASGNVLLDGKKIKNLAEMQNILEKNLQLPPNSGKDLDDVYEVLVSDYKAESIVRIKHMAALRKKIGEQYIEDLIEVVGQASDENAHVVLILE